MTTDVLVVALAMVLFGVIGEAGAQAPAPAPVYSVTYVEVMPTARANGIALLKRYRDTTRNEEGNLRCEAASRIGQPHQLVILEVWKDQNALDAHGRSASTTQFRENVHAIRNAPLDERVHVGISVGPLQPGPTGEAVYVVTHVDVVPTRKDDGVAAVKQLGDDSRKEPDNVRFEVGQQANRPNHFTLVEIWKDAKAVESHSMRETTRRFRDKLGPMTGALYDERFYKAID